MVIIKNLRNEKPFNPWAFKVDRSSALGNPFYMTGEEDRDAVCEQYEAYFRELLADGTSFKHRRATEEFVRMLEAYEKYGVLELFCWCAPKRCHAETIAAAIREAVYGCQKEEAKKTA